MSFIHRIISLEAEAHRFISSVQFSPSVMSDSFVTPWTAAHQSSLYITNSQSLFKLMSIESVMPSNHLILCLPLLPPPSIFPSIRVFSSESVLYIRWPNYWSFSFNISPSKEDSVLFPLGLTGLISLKSKGLSRVFFNTTVQKHPFFGTQQNSVSFCPASFCTPRPNLLLQVSSDFQLLHSNPLRWKWHLFFGVSYRRPCRSS